MKSFAFIILLFSRLLFANSNDWACQVIDYQPGSIDLNYSNPNLALGPASKFTDNSNDGVEAAKVELFEAAWSSNQIVSIGNGGHLTLKFDPPVINQDDPYHLYGVDLIVYGNTFFIPLNLAEKYSSPWIIDSREPSEIWLSHDLTNWFKAKNRSADSLMPTQSIDILGRSSNYLKPINPAILTNDWCDLSWSYTNTVSSYDGAAGGAPVDLSDLLTADNIATNLVSASYIKFVDLSGTSAEIDAVAKVELLPEPAAFSLLLFLVTFWARLKP